MDWSDKDSDIARCKGMPITLIDKLDFLHSYIHTRPYKFEKHHISLTSWASPCCCDNWLHIRNGKEGLHK